ncbi:MAG: cobyric acid synthase [Lachnospiraceae bacterium]|nr:cobyric acid synthase [Lachnospiraceae bacterium]
MAKVIMVQGTMSNAGKSLLTAGLCRIFKQDGYKVAPFKSQNMALNSFITEEGLEMGRAQVMQAEAAGIKPSVLMNPILLKPTNDTGSQVIVNGEVLGNMSARDYFAYKHKLKKDVMYAYNKLAEENDIIVIEGAGSPAEINLKDEDIVNMGMAKMAKAPVLLVGDIDRGGVFAQLAGTVMLLEDDEKAMVKGLIINKFRGDKTILDPGVKMLEDITKIDVVGVAPYLSIEVEDEDSLTERFNGKQEVGMIDIAVIRIPRISNFTDFNPFESINGVSLRYVHNVNELKNPDMIIIPGTKNTMEDLLWMRQNGLEAAICKAAAAGKIIYGVCGGYQMLGETLSDPDGVEAGGEIKGMGLLPMDTVFAGQKTRTRVTGTFENVGGALASLSGVHLEGYEIHMGVTTMREDADARTLTKISNFAGAKEADAAAKAEWKTDSVWKTDGVQKGNIYGTYVHSCFDKEGVARAIVTAIAESKGLDTENISGVDYQEFKETQYDILADALRKHLDIKRIYEIMEEGI